jgi:hypothetical protein
LESVRRPARPSHLAPQRRVQECGERQGHQHRGEHDLRNEERRPGVVRDRGMVFAVFDAARRRRRSGLSWSGDRGLRKLWDPHPIVRERRVVDVGSLQRRGCVRAQRERDMRRGRDADVWGKLPMDRVSESRLRLGSTRAAVRQLRDANAIVQQRRPFGVVGVP